MTGDAVERAGRLQAQGHLVVAGIPGAFNTPRELMGEEMACLAYYDQPELMQDIFDTLCDTAMKVLEPISTKLRIDQLSVHEDLAGKIGASGWSGSGSAVLEALLWQGVGFAAIAWMPHFPAGHGWQRQQRDPGDAGLRTDGRLSDGGRRPGWILSRYGRCMGGGWAMAGGIDKHVLRQDKSAIRRELEYKMQPMMRQAGGIVFGLDHRIPNGTPLENYRYYVHLGREILGLPPRTVTGKGWQRMAL